MAGNITASDVWAAISGGKRISIPGLSAIETLSGNLTIDTTYGNLMALDPGGSARDVTLPAAFDGGGYLIVNTADAAETITVKDSGASTVATVAQNRAVVVTSNANGWVQFALFVTA